MKITEKTPYRLLLPIEDVLTPESIEALKESAEQKFGSCYNLTIDEFFGITGGDYSILGDLSDPSVFQVYWLKRFADFAKEFASACKRLTIEPTPEQKQAQTGCVEMSPQESMLTFTRSYFGLPSFFDAGKRTIGEYLTARKDTYNEQRVQRNYEEIQKNKFKKR